MIESVRNRNVCKIVRERSVMATKKPTTCITMTPIDIIGLREQILAKSSLNATFPQYHLTY